MPHDDITIICPYYHKTLGDIMFCEGFAAFNDAETVGCFFKQEFKSKESRATCLEKYCTTFKYNNCRFAALNDAFLTAKNNY